jgi:hypothetical protein
MESLLEKKRDSPRVIKEKLKSEIYSPSLNESLYIRGITVDGISLD